MTAALHNIVIEQGSTFNLNITWTGPDGSPIDLTGYQVRMQVRQSVDSEPALVDFDSAALGAGQAIGALDATGVIDVTVSDEETATLDFPSGVYDLIVESPAGVVSRVVQGRVAFEKAVTR